MQHDTITTAAQLAELYQHMGSAQRIGIDTEFVSEDTFRPELCLIQVVTDERIAVIDPYPVGDVTPFWETLADGKHITIAHAAREEINFSLTACNRPPANLFDTQIAAGFCSTEYPSSYGAVVTKFLGKKAAKGEQRTDWRRRPLTDAQIDYALEDVRHLFGLYDKMEADLKKSQRGPWLAEEMEAWLIEVCEARERPRWRKVSGIGNLSHRSLEIVREMWQWRQAEAERRNVPPRRVLRDDLIVELAKRKSDKPDRIKGIRGMQRNAGQSMINELADCVRRGLEAPLDDKGGSSRRSMPSQLNLLGQFLSPALTSICRGVNMATSLVGTASDVRDLIAYRMEFGSMEGRDVPTLARGWRADLVGHQIEELLAGQKSIRIEDPQSKHPLAFDNVSEQPS